MINLNGYVMAALDLETTGHIDGYHDVIQVCVLPLDDNFDPREDVSPFYMNMKPNYPERAIPDAMRVNGLNLDELALAPDIWQVADCFDDWFESLGLGMFRKLIAITQNGEFDIPFAKHWLGHTGYDKYFCRNGRDTMQTALYLNDQAAWKNRPIPFNRVGLKELCKHFGIRLEKHHDALADCLATAEVYRELLRYEV